MTKDTHDIIIKGARVNNLKNVDVSIPRNSFTVITGLSGSGKSSLAFDTLYAEGQRRYVESLSAYARQFLGRMAKPEVDFIKGIPPAIAVEQKVNTRNSRSTVGTSTEIYDYLRLLFARIGHTISPVSGKDVKKHTEEDVIAAAQSYPEGTRIAVTAPIREREGRSFAKQLEVYAQQGYSRLYRDGAFYQIEEILGDSAIAGGAPNPGYELLVDRLSVAAEGDELSRLADSAETAFFEGDETCVLTAWDGDAVHRHEFSRRFEADGITFLTPSDLMFNFNNPYGACPTCEGYGKAIGIDERLVIPNQSLSLYEGAVAPWRGPSLGMWQKEFIRRAQQFGFPIHKPYCDLTDEQRGLLWHGNGMVEGIDQFFKMVEENLYKIQYRVLLARYRGKTVCPDCHGTRLRPEALYVKVGGKNIAELTDMSVKRLREWFDGLALTEHEQTIAARLLKEITNRLGFLANVGLDYLTLDRQSSTLSGGESQRINLATSLGSSLVGSLYILDEPSIGLHPRDTDRLIGVLKDLRNIGNTVVVVEHDSEIMRQSDYLVDVGPDAGSGGGRIVYQGPTSEIETKGNGYTAGYLSGRLNVAVPKSRRKSNSYISVEGARENNLKNIDVKFPLGVMTVVTGVSGSGKSTLVKDILYRALKVQLGEQTDAPGAHHALGGDLKRVHAVEFVDQNPIGKSNRSNPATYIKAFDEIRKIFASQQGAKQLGFTPAYFSFNTEGGRCEECKGEGTITIEMQFMADLTIPCEACGGKRFKKEVLDILYNGKSIYDVLEMTVDEAIEFFGRDESDSTARRVVTRLQPLQDVGLGYVKLGQSSSTLSGGENQRVKLAYFLGMDNPEPTVFIFDEPTTGLHLHDINRLTDSFDRLIARGHTIIIIEHNLDVIKRADYVIDIGPEGGDRGGNLVATGTPEAVAANPDSYTGRYLKPLLG